MIASFEASGLEYGLLNLSPPISYPTMLAFLCDFLCYLISTLDIIKFLFVSHFAVQLLDKIVGASWHEISWKDNMGFQKTEMFSCIVWILKPNYEQEQEGTGEQISTIMGRLHFDI